MMVSLPQGKECALRTSSAAKGSRWPIQMSYSLNQILLLFGDFDFRYLGAKTYIIRDLGAKTYIILRYLGAKT
jgi:hypothetical protein